MTAALRLYPMVTYHLYCFVGNADDEDEDGAGSAGFEGIGEGEVHL